MEEDKSKVEEPVASDSETSAIGNEEHADDTDKESNKVEEERVDDAGASDAPADSVDQDLPDDADGAEAAHEPSSDDGKEEASPDKGEDKTTGRSKKKTVLVVLAVLVVLLGVVGVLFATHVICIHKWKSPTCTEPGQCEICGRIEGQPLGHDYQDATCTQPRTCSRCGRTEGQPLGHKLEEATCTHGKTCSVCGQEVGDPLGHNVAEWKVTTEPTCEGKGQREGLCSRCSKNVKEDVPAKGHTPGDWQVVKDINVNATSGDIIPGTREIRCTACGKTLQSEEFTVEATYEQKNALKKAKGMLSSYTTYSYTRLIAQMEREGFSTEDATFGVDHCGADWNEQALKSAKSYLSYSPSSRSALISHLEREGFTDEQASYAADQLGYQ